MATKKKRIATYLPAHIEKPFRAFQSEKALDNDSQALIQILSDYFGVAHSVSSSVAHSVRHASVERVEALEIQVGELLKLIGESDSRMEEAVSEAKSELKSELQGELPSSRQTDLFSEPETPAEGSESKLSEGLSMRALEKRWPASRRIISRMLKQLTADEFRAWSSNQDPDGVSWEYREGKLFPIRKTA